MFTTYRLYIYGAVALAVLSALAYTAFECNAARSQLAATKLELSELRRDAAERLAKANAETALAQQRATELQQKASNEYQKKLADLRAAYAARLRDSQAPARSPDVPRLPDPAHGVDGPAADSGLASACAETTLQLTELQRWIRDALKTR